MNSFTSTRDELSDGSKLSDCPYAPSDPRWKEWQHTFARRQQLDQEAWSRGEERAHARMEALGMKMAPRYDWEYAPQGIRGSIFRIIDEPPLPDLSQLFAPVANAVADTLAKAWTDMANIVGLTSIKVDALMQAYRKVDVAATTEIMRGIVDDSDPPHSIRGKPAPRPRQAICPRHGQPKGSCRACWR